MSAAARSLVRAGAVARRAAHALEASAACLSLPLCYATPGSFLPLGHAEQDARTGSVRGCLPFGPRGGGSRARSHAVAAPTGTAPPRPAPPSAFPCHSRLVVVVGARARGVIDFSSRLVPRMDAGRFAARQEQRQPCYFQFPMSEPSSWYRLTRRRFLPELFLFEKINLNG